MELLEDLIQCAHSVSTHSHRQSPDLSFSGFRVLWSALDLSRLHLVSHSRPRSWNRPPLLDTDNDSNEAQWLRYLFRCLVERLLQAMEGGEETTGVQPSFQTPQGAPTPAQGQTLVRQCVYIVYCLYTLYETQMGKTHTEAVNSDPAIVPPVPADTPAASSSSAAAPTSASSPSVLSFPSARLPPFHSSPVISIPLPQHAWPSLSKLLVLLASSSETLPAAHVLARLDRAGAWEFTVDDERDMREEGRMQAAEAGEMWALPEEIMAEERSQKVQEVKTLTDFKWLRTFKHDLSHLSVQSVPLLPAAAAAVPPPLDHLSHNVVAGLSLRTRTVASSYKKQFDALFQSMPADQHEGAHRAMLHLTQERERRLRSTIEGRGAQAGVAHAQLPASDFTPLPVANSVPSPLLAPRSPFALPPLLGDLTDSPAFGSTNSDSHHHALPPLDDGHDHEPPEPGAVTQGRAEEEQEPQQMDGEQKEMEEEDSQPVPSSPASSAAPPVDPSSSALDFLQSLVSSTEGGAASPVLDAASLSMWRDLLSLKVDTAAPPRKEVERSDSPLPMHLQQELDIMREDMGVDPAISEHAATLTLSASSSSFPLPFSPPRPLPSFLSGLQSLVDDYTHVTHEQRSSLGGDHSAFHGHAQGRAGIGGRGSRPIGANQTEQAMHRRRQRETEKQQQRLRAQQREERPVALSLPPLPPSSASPSPEFDRIVSWLRQRKQDILLQVSTQEYEGEEDGPRWDDDEPDWAANPEDEQGQERERQEQQEQRSMSLLEDFDMGDAIVTVSPHISAPASPSHAPSHLELGPTAASAEGEEERKENETTAPMSPASRRAAKAEASARMKSKRKASRHAASAAEAAEGKDSQPPSIRRRKRGAAAARSAPSSSDEEEDEVDPILQGFLAQAQQVLTGGDVPAEKPSKRSKRAASPQEEEEKKERRQESAASRATKPKVRGRPSAAAAAAAATAAARGRAEAAPKRPGRPRRAASPSLSSSSATADATTHAANFSMMSALGLSDMAGLDMAAFLSPVPAPAPLAASAAASSTEAQPNDAERNHSLLSDLSSTPAEEASAPPKRRTRKVATAQPAATASKSTIRRKAKTTAAAGVASNPYAAPTPITVTATTFTASASSSFALAPASSAAVSDSDSDADDESAAAAWMAAAQAVMED